MNFSEAIEALKNGKKVRRTVWYDSSFIKVWMLYDELVILRDSDIIYLASYCDMIAEDWMIVD